MRILMVCLGNICRSPLAEGILKFKVSPQKVFVDSAGTAGYHIGETPDSRSIDVAKKHGINISNQMSRKFEVEDFDAFDLIYAMDYENYLDIIKKSRNDYDKNKVKMILNELHPNSDKSVPDPYYGGNQGFNDVYKMLDTVCEVIAKKIQ